MYLLIGGNDLKPHHFYLGSCFTCGDHSLPNCAALVRRVPSTQQRPTVSSILR